MDQFLIVIFLFKCQSNINPNKFNHSHTDVANGQFTLGYLKDTKRNAKAFLIG